jgi:hypothetical protein
VLRSLRAIARLSPPEQNPAMHLGVQGFYAPTQHFRPSREVRNIAYADSGFAQQLGRAPGGNNLNPTRRQLPHKFRQPTLVINTHQRAINRHRLLRKTLGKQ